VKSIPEIIKQASSSPLGIFALMIVVVGLLAYVFFKRAPIRIRVAMFSSILLGVVLYGVAITHAAQPGISSGRPDEDKLRPSTLGLSGVVVDAGDNSGIALAELSVSSGDERAITDSNGTFHLEIRAGETPIHLRVTKKGYDTLQWQVTPPLTGMTIPLSKSRAH
jgi:hypothetical protein